MAKIVESARVLLAEDPKATLDDIAEHARVHRATLNRHFRSREALIAALLDELSITLDRRIAAIEPERGAPEDAVRSATHAWLDESRNWRAARYVPLSDVPHSGEVHQRLRARMIALFERGQRDGVIRDDLSARKVYLAWSGLITIWIAFRPDAGADELAEDIVAFLKRSG